MTRVGVDEAGKGPVLGPMVCAAVRAPPDALPDGVDDSKRLSAAERERLATVLREDPDVAVATAAVEVERIDDPETDMNGLTVAGQAAAVGGVVAAGDRVVADAGDVDAARFGRRVAEAVEATVEVVAEHGADETHAVVGAASVVAKVERDRRIAAIDDRHDAPVGSGYPSDPTTRAFLRSHVEETGDLPACARRSWATCEEVLAATAQSGLDDFHDTSS